MPEYRRIMLGGGACVQVRRESEDRVAGDGRRVAAADAVHLPPVVPTKIVAVHLNHHSRVAEFGARLPPAPGDVLLSGTPAGSRPGQPGDVAEVAVDGLGRLVSHIVAGPVAVPSVFGAQPSQSEEVISTALGGDWEFRGIRPPMRA